MGCMPLRSAVRLSALTLAVGLAFGRPALAQGGEREVFERQLSTVKVLNDSLRRLSAGRSDSSAVAVDARIRRAQALLPTNPAAARVELDEAYALVKSAVREIAVARSEGTVEVPRQPDETAPRTHEAFAGQLETVRALTQSLRRVSKERGVDRSEAIARIESRTREAASLAAGEPEMARAALAEAADLVKGALRDLPQDRPPALGSAPSPADPRPDFERRVESARALQAALARISQEKNDQQGALAAQAAQRLLNDAESAARRGEWISARAQATVAFERSREHIERLRRGDTLVRSLSFATDEEEYRYELDRNETFQMLEKLLVPAAKEPRNRGFPDRAAALRRAAEDQAARGDHKGAVKSLEEATREMLKGLRGAGVLIPG